MTSKTSINFVNFDEMKLLKFFFFKDGYITCLVSILIQIV